MKSTVSVFMITLIILSTFALAFRIQWVGASGTIYIRADGSIDPPTTNITSSDNVTYIFTDNIYGSIVVERSNITVDGAGYTLKGPSESGFHWSLIDNVTIRNTNIENFVYGVWLEYSSGSSIVGNTIANSGHTGIKLVPYCSNSCIANNKIISNHTLIGIWSSQSSSNIISGNHITAHQGYGVLLEYSWSNSIFGNNITGNSGSGIYISLNSSNNRVFENNIAINLVGIYLQLCLSNRFFHNNLINNTCQVWIEYIEPTVNIWDDGYPGGGNYWTNYCGTDLYRGSNQNINGSDGIGDIPHIVTANNTDRYPLMGPIGSLTMTGENVTVFPADDVCLIFENIIEEGLTTVEKPETGPTPPPGFSLMQYYVIETTADYAGQISVRIVYEEFMRMLANTTQEELRLLQCVMLLGDVDEDCDVDIFDIVTMASAYNAKYPSPRYDPSCDLDGDGDIDIFDIVGAAGNYNKNWKPETGWHDITTWFDPETNSIFGVTQHISIFGVTRG